MRKENKLTVEVNPCIMNFSQITAYFLHFLIIQTSISSIQRVTSSLQARSQAHSVSSVYNLSRIRITHRAASL